MTAVNVSALTNTVTVTENGSSSSSTVVTVSQTSVVTATTAGPQGPSGIAAGGLPTGGDPGNILLKSSYANYESTWAANLDGGTFN
jgi:hypothetical protein